MCFKTEIVHSHQTINIETVCFLSMNSIDGIVEVKTGVCSSSVGGKKRETLNVSCTLEDLPGQVSVFFNTK